MPDGVEVFKLFETTKPSGTGLGLAVCREIARAHGGELAFENLQPHGARFSITLPPDRTLEADPAPAG